MDPAQCPDRVVGRLGRMGKKESKLIIVGDGPFAEVAYEYFTYDSPRDSQRKVVTFSVEEAYLTRDRLFDLPVVPFEHLERIHDPVDHEFFVAVTYTQANALRKRLYDEAKRKGYTPASYISSRAFVWPNCRLGEHCFVFENNVIQPFAKVGRNVVLWSGNHIGHHSIIKDHCFISSQVVVSGNCDIGESCFLGVNATLRDNITLGQFVVVGSGAIVMRNCPTRSLVRPAQSTQSIVDRDLI